MIMDRVIVIMVMMVMVMRVLMIVFVVMMVLVLVFVFVFVPMIMGVVVIMRMLVTGSLLLFSHFDPQRHRADDDQAHQQYGAGQHPAVECGRQNLEVRKQLGLPHQEGQAAQQASGGDAAQLVHVITFAFVSMVVSHGHLLLSA